MRDLAILEFVTLDGVMQAPSQPDEDTTGGFTGGGWARGCWEDVMAQVMTEAMAEPYDLLLGRTTWDLFASTFPQAPSDNPVAGRLNAARKYVVTSGTDLTPWDNSVAITGDVVSEIKQLKAQSGPLLQVHGSWQLVQTLLSAGLVDEYRLWTFPVVVGSGKRLFETGALPSELRLVKSASTTSGATMSIYRRSAA